MNLPTISQLEELAPDLRRLANYQKSDVQKRSNFLRLIQNAVRRWIIKQSLYNSASDYFVEIETEWFNCAAWRKAFKAKNLNIEQKSLEYLILEKYNFFDQQQWQQSLAQRYQIDLDFVEKILTLRPFSVSDRTLNNDFWRLSQLPNPILEKESCPKGKYRKVKLTTKPNELNDLALNSWQSGSAVCLSFLNDDLSDIVEPLFTKINGSQRLFLHTEYVVKEELQDLAADWADCLKELWKKSSVVPIQIKYHSASQGNKSYYIVYPVCLYYHQRAYYLCAFGQNPATESDLCWYNYRLERILQLNELSWQDSEFTKNLHNKIYEQQQVKYQYTPQYIQEQLELAYGFDFYRDSATMVLRFNQDFDQRYIKNTIRHQTFEAITDLESVKNLIAEQCTPDQEQRLLQTELFNKIARAQNDAYYSLRYRVGDNNVIMRLRAWSFNVEVLFPWELRQRIKADMQENWKLYESDR